MKSFLSSNAQVLLGCNLSILERMLAAYWGARIGILHVPALFLGTVPALSLSSSSHGTLQLSLPPFLNRQWQQTTQPAQPGAAASPTPRGLSSPVLSKETIWVLLSSAILFPLKKKLLRG